MKYKSTKCLLAFFARTILNIILTTFLIQQSFGQTNKYIDQKPVTVEIVRQNDSPVQISAVNVVNAAESYQEINCFVQNVSSEKIAAFVLLHTGEAGKGGSITGFFQSFGAGQTVQESVVEERADLKPNGKIFLSIDYVLFEDGTFWGKDSQHQSDYILGRNEGQEKAIEQIKQLLAAQSENAVSALLTQRISELNPPDFDRQKTDKWRSGFTAGYRSVVSRLQSAYETRGIEAVSSKLEEIEKSAKRDKK